ncbi:hypothetical protein [Bacillus sp. B15-48]|uniref:hypothetical protein n=1 Tax=Bacillus sp. B15-48 TaxID=1548601 RepID=UPI0019401845|nr:hypothetical protein [Bacillus sp. B15-48]MBM4762846.1 hypothetical protein [Bacillus sp. B15-48]
MKAKLMSSFAAGLIVAASVCGVVYFFEPAKATSTEVKENLPLEEMRNELFTAGYLVYSEEEWEQELAKIEQEHKLLLEQEKEHETNESPAEPTETIIYKTILNVASGMTSIDVGNALVKGKIIDNAMTFFNEVEKKGLANGLRPGTYELDSEMNTDEVISILFK